MSESIQTQMSEGLKGENLKSENIQMICTVNNRAKQELKVQSKDLDWGKFTAEPVAIPSKAVLPAFRSTGRQGSASGTQGKVVYQIGDDAAAIITISGDVPWAPGASNKVTTSTFSEDVGASIAGFVGSGPVESVTITVVDGRGAVAVS